MTSSIINRVASIRLGIDGNVGDFYDWIGVNEVKLTPLKPNEDIEIPSGEMIHQYIHPPHIELEITCKDLRSLTTALWSTVIDGTGDYAINNSWTVGTGNTIAYFIIRAVDQTGAIISYQLTNVEIETVIPTMIANKEAGYLVKAHARLYLVSGL